MFRSQLFLVTKKTGVVLFFLSVILLTIASVLNLRVLVDLQNEHCMPFTVAIVRYHHIDELHRGDIVAFTPGMAMGELFREKIIVKMVGGVPGDKIFVQDGRFSINGVDMGHMSIAETAAKYLGKNKADFNRTEIVPDGSILMVGTLPRSFDGRYWGFLPKTAVMGSVSPIF